MEQDYTQLAEALRMRDEGKTESEILARFSGAAKTEIGESLDLVHWIEAESDALIAPPRASLEKLLMKIEAVEAKPVPASALKPSAIAKPVPASALKPSAIAKPVAAVAGAAASTFASAARTAAPAVSSLAAALPLSKKAILAKMNSNRLKPSTDSAMKTEIARKPVASSMSMPPEMSAGMQPVVLGESKDWAQFMTGLSWKSFLPVAAVAAVLLFVGVYRGLPKGNPTLPNQVAIAPADSGTASTAAQTASDVTVAMVSPGATNPSSAASPAAMKTASLAAPASGSNASSKSVTPDQAYSQLGSGSDNEANAVSGSDSDVSDSNSKSVSGLSSTYDENTI